MNDAITSKISETSVQKTIYLRFEVLIEVLMKIRVFWDVTQCQSGG